MTLSEIALLLRICTFATHWKRCEGRYPRRSTASLKRRWYSKFPGHYDFGLLTTVLTLGGFDLHCAIPLCPESWVPA